MTNPIQEDAQLAQLSDDFIRDLEPENQRYDITLAQDFVISVLPNGIKTWAFIYDFQGRHRRKTLGVFPEMNFEDAKVALEKARASMVRMDEPTVAPNEFGQRPAVLGGGMYVPETTSEPFNWPRFFKILGVLAVLAVIGAVATLVSRGWNPFGGSPAPAESVSEPSRPSLPFTLARDTNKPDETQKPDQTTTRELPFEVRPKPAEDAQKEAPAPSPAEVPPAASSAQSMSTPRDDAPDRATATPETPNDAPVTSASGTLARSGGAQTSGSATPVSDTASDPVSTPTPTPTRPMTTLTTPTKATAYGGRVSRSRLTSRVQDLEPVDTLGPEISYKNSGFTRVFYFTELREFSDGTVVHRWSLNGEVQEEVELQVRTSWRWRTYSNKDLTPGLNGQWKVETIDASGKVLDTKEFTYDYQ